ncbi:20284_t:CDS:2 [Gigaspora margarita]|uniref:20284_t:CDS:1 n=1 Tax=Gigaspora margarita TaxID=4874 RepID=A0ABN7W958_GIGMA|nr:20284_t:CDS:2 [Gigaspora margarita]
MVCDYHSKSNKHGNEANVASESPKINKNEVVTDITINREALLKIDGWVQGQNALILIDSGASKDFMSSNFVKQTNLFKDKNQSSPIELADSTRCQTQGSIKKNNIEVLPLQKYDIILEKPWLYDLNPRIDWRNNQIVVKKDKWTHKIKTITSGETYKEIKDEYKEDAYLKNILKALEDPGSDETK